MNSTERLNLQKMINANDVVDQTENIRREKHSSKIREDVKTLVELKQKYPRLERTNPIEFDKLCVNRSSFLFNNYTDIFNKVKKDEIDLTILDNFLIVLKSIEDGKCDQHEASFKIGKLLKEMYIDSALKKSNKLDQKLEKEQKKNKKPKEAKPVNISWKQYKEQTNNVS
tara:strand:+ start:659 stop:1168 length:510 start_codon:yes stop_codon:yes gene_type:complete